MYVINTYVVILKAQGQTPSSFCMEGPLKTSKRGYMNGVLKGE